MSAPFNDLLEQAIAAASAYETDLLNTLGVVAVGAGPQRTAASSRAELRSS